MEYYFNKDKDMSIIKWVGGKSKLIDKFIDKIPNKGNIYYEPFIGSASVLIKVLETKKYNHYIVGDINKPLICLYGIIKTDVENLIVELDNLIESFNESDDKEDFYYNIRNSFNEKIVNLNKNSDLVKVASEFVFINKICFRGLYRVNKSGEFNVPYGNYKKPNIYNKEEFLRLNKLFQNVEFKFTDYKNLIKDIQEEDFIYLDPPYINTFDSYTSIGFDSEEFAGYVNNLNCKCLISNSEDFKELLNDNFNVEIIEVQDKINSKSPGSVRNEILAWNF